MQKKFSLKDHLFNKKSVSFFADLLYVQDKLFPKEQFVKNVLADFPDLELKQRISRMVDELYVSLPTDYLLALERILIALPKKLDPRKTDGDFGEFILVVFSEYIARYGCTQKYLQMSLNALRECTQRHSAEFAIRHFINAFPNETMRFLCTCATSDNYHVRRLASEGSRPKLPWALGINLDYKKALSLLDQLYFDNTRYVTRSVANHMNDISKIDSNLVIQTLRRWQQSGKQIESEMDFIMNHSLRTLVKQGNLDALGLLGYHGNPKITVSDFVLHTEQINLGEYLEFSFSLLSHSSQKLMIDYVIHYVTKSGSTHPKVFKIKKGAFHKDEIVVIKKKQAFRKMTTKKLYPGIHRCEIQINGHIVHRFRFELV